MKKCFVLFVSLFVSAFVFGQSQITEKGYFYSPDGFVCKDGDIYTADMKTIVRFGVLSKNIETEYRYWNHDAKEMIIPDGAEVIPSNILYHPTPHHYYGSGTDVAYNVFIPSSVKYIAVDAFIYPFVRFFNLENSSSTRENITRDSDATEVARYNLQGRKIDNPEHGINIVQMSDRSVHKEIVK